MRDEGSKKNIFSAVVAAFFSSTLSILEMNAKAKIWFVSLRRFW
jgi:hypothetical protein